MKKFLILLLTAGLLTACKNADDAVTLIKGVAGIAKGSKTVQEKQGPPPKLESFGYTLPTYPDSLVNSTAQTFKTDIQYTPMKPQIIYFDEQGKMQKTRQAKGYYRELLGKTADGRWVAQDFYQDSKVLQTAPFIVPKTGDINSFDTEGNLEGLHIHFDRAGNLDSIVTFDKDGKQVSPLALYEKGKLLAQMKAGDAVQMAFYYEDGKNIAAVMDFPQGYDAGGTTTFFRRDGSAIVAMQKNKGEITQVSVWNAAGERPSNESAEKKEIEEEVDSIDKRVTYVGARLVEYSESEYVASEPAVSAAQ